MRGRRLGIAARPGLAALTGTGLLLLALAGTPVWASAASPGPSASAAPTPGRTAPAPTTTASPSRPAPSPTAASRAPGPPTSVLAVPGDASATVTWTAPASDGGSPILRYAVTSTPDNRTATVLFPVTRATLTGLTNGRAYTFAVTATNVAGTSLPGMSASVTPRAPSVPTSPTSVVAVAGDGSATISWKASASDGGSAILRYVVTSTPDNRTATVLFPVTRATVTGLKNGTAYTFTVVATNAVGSSAPSAASNRVTPAPAVVPPSPPRQVQAVAGDRSATVRWLPPASTGGGPLLRYTVAATPGSSIAVARPDATSAVVNGLTNGTAYTFTVTATNAVGTSVPSVRTLPVIPQPGPAPSPLPPAPPVLAPPAGPLREAPIPAAPTPERILPTLPDPPDQPVAVARFEAAAVTWARPRSDGGTPITGYTVTGSPDGITVSVAAEATGVTVPGLTNGILYTFTVRAINAVGSGPPSEASGGIVPDLVEPDEPTDVAAAVGDGAAIVIWGSPESDGGSPVTGYLITTFPERREMRVGPDATSVTVDRLVNGAAYRFLVQAVNDVGAGPAATSEEVIPAAEPDVPYDVSAELFDTVVTVSWSPPDWDGGSPIVAYTVAASPGGPQVTVDGNTTSVTLSGLAAGLTSGRMSGLIYNFTVTASNAVATSAPSAPAVETLAGDDCEEFCAQDDNLDMAPDPSAVAPKPVRL